ncbi:hypothetical protein GLYMA_10G058050v4 [Glycine max]|nr:hypothetical protein GLYMA_10G058050v4 [Glycine max]KAH1136974.1 hypothetical protein GYH30_027097 [Glycine max]
MKHHLVFFLFSTILLTKNTKTDYQGLSINVHCERVSSQCHKTALGNEYLNPCPFLVFGCKMSHKHG